MSFLAPIFLIGLGALAAPVIWHLIRRRPTDTAPFPSLMFLEPSPPKVTKRSRLEDLILLLIRLLILALIAMAFARPYFGKPSVVPPAADAAQQVILLLDVSASMQRSGAWSAALDKAEASLKKLGPADAAEIRVFDETSETVFTWDQWRNSNPSERITQSLQTLRSRKPGWKSTHLSRAILSASESLEANRPASGGNSMKQRIVVVSDFQAGSKLEGLAGHTWSKELAVSLESVSAPVENVSIHWFGEGDSLTAQTNASGLKVRVVNHPRSKVEQFRLGWTGSEASSFSGKPLAIQVPPGQTRSISLPPAESGQRSDGLLIEGDSNPFDNRLHRVSEETGNLRILALSDEDPASERSMLFFLNRAILETSRQKVNLVTRKSSEPTSAGDLEGTRLVVLMEPVGASAWTVAAEALRRGKTVLVGLRGTSNRGELGKLLGEPELKLEESTGQDAMWTRMDWDHPLISIFSDPRFSDFTRIRFWKHRKIQMDHLPGARVVASFDQGDPALAVIPVGTGQCVLLTSSWSLEDSQLALSSKFVPLIYRLMEWSGALVENPSQFLVGSSVTLPPAKGGETRWLVSPDGRETEVLADKASLVLDQPGIFQLKGRLETNRFAANLSPEESRVQPMLPDELERLGVPVKMGPAETSSPSKLSSEKRLLKEAASVHESRQKGWRWFLSGALVLILFETVISGWISRRGITAS